eukprot:TRINITY_DN28396_c0_g1_i1.p1 TRINITY_DN28396_c0_g1~~TRINITY_DN28396_c0_g1_i1.p1  ORF type:complete len:168 (+),score=6.19 TRINITY_DN28396_c0_g1_i1:133-636(+)
MPTFHFLMDKIMYNQCARQNSKWWCAVTVNSDSSYEKWEYCDPETCIFPVTNCDDDCQCASNQNKQNRLPENEAYRAEYLGRVVIKMFQKLGATQFFQIGRNHRDSNTGVPPAKFGVYLFFLGTANLKQMQGEWKLIELFPKLQLLQQKARISFLGILVHPMTYRLG